MRDGTELSGQSYGFGNLYSGNAQGVLKLYIGNTLVDVDTGNLNELITMCIPCVLQVLTEL